MKIYTQKEKRNKKVNIIKCFAWWAFVGEFTMYKHTYFRKSVCVCLFILVCRSICKILFGMMPLKSLARIKPNVRQKEMKEIHCRSIALMYYVYLDCSAIDVDRWQYIKNGNNRI